MNKPWLIYGANGYSGHLILKQALEVGLKPIVAGRNAAEIGALASKYGLESRIFDLKDNNLIRTSLEGVGLVVHCAGPFSATSAPMIEACINSRTHYFDITGEIDVFEHAHSRKVSQRAKGVDVVVCPGIGFDVVPTDCVAMTLAACIPNATYLTLGFAAKSRFSPGTAKTMVEGLSTGMRHRRNGVIQSCAVKTRHIDFGTGETKLAMNLAWGDVSTAFYTTGIPNIDVFIASHPKLVRKTKMTRFIRPFLGLSFVQNRLKRKIDAAIKGPTDEQRAKDKTYVWGEISNDSGATVEAFLETGNGYTVTALAPVAIVSHWLNSGFDQVGSLTPARLMGKSFVSTLEGCSDIQVRR